MLNFVAVAPHPPAIIPDIGHSQATLAKKTIKALNDLAQELKKFQPETIVVVSPHGPMRYDKFTINLEDNVKSNFSAFGGENLSEQTFQTDVYLARKILAALRKNFLPAEPIREEKIDYGSMIPLYYLLENFSQKPQLILLTFTALDWKNHFLLGKVLKSVFDQEEKNIAFLASADLSHRLSKNSPAGYSASGVKFDQTLLDLLKKNDTEKILHFNPSFCNQAQECGLRSIIIALGLLAETSSSFVAMSYEAPFGVGHLVGRWKFRSTN